MDISLSLDTLFNVFGFIAGWTLIALVAMLAISLVLSVAKGLISLVKGYDLINEDPEMSDYAEPERLKPVK